MFYAHTKKAVFLARPNRFLARVLLDGKEVLCHVKNTGRLKELLIPGTDVILEYHPDAVSLGRKTEYSLIGVSKQTPKGPTWVNIDSQAPNKAAFLWLTEGNGLPFCPRPAAIRQEAAYGQSRFDLAFSYDGQPWFMEVKGVTLDVNGTAMFPDAPTERGVRHLNELCHAVRDGYGAAILFVIQMKGIRAFSPNEKRHPEFASALLQAKNCGVHIWAYDCIVTENSMQMDQPVPVVLVPEP